MIATLMFGRDIALAANANVIAVGECATLDMGGFVHVYQPVGEGGRWERTAELRSGNSEKDFFGASVAFSADGSVLVVGAPRFGTGEGISATSHGRVFVFVADEASFQGGGDSYTLSQELALASPAEYDRLGTEVAITPDGTFVYGMSMLISCAHSSCAGTNPGNRGIHVWTRPDAVSAYAYEASVQTTEPGLFFSMQGQTFGAAPDGSRLYIKSYDPEYIAEGDAMVDGNYSLPFPTMLAVWERDPAGPSWNETTPIRAPTRQMASQTYGARVVIEPVSGELYVSAPRNDSHVFRVDPGTGAVLQSFAEGNAALYDVSGVGDCNQFVQPWKTDGSFFGQDISIAPNSQLMLVGAPFGVDSNLGKGKAYLYTRNVGVSDDVWNLVDTFESDHVFAYQPSGFQAPGFTGSSYDPAIRQSVMDEFGLDLAINNEYIVVGSKGIDKVYIFRVLDDYLYVAPPPPPNPPSPPPPPVAAIIIPPPPPSGGSIALALIIGLIVIFLVLVALFFAARFGIKAYYKRKLQGMEKEAEDGSGDDDDDDDDDDGGHELDDF